MKKLFILITLLLIGIGAQCAAEQGSTGFKDDPLLNRLDKTCQAALGYDHDEYIANKTGDDAGDPEMRDALRDWLDCQDKFLNVVYKELRADVADRVKAQDKKLVEAQKSWLKVRDLTCEVADVDGGTMYIITSMGCEARMTSNRINELEYLIYLYTEH